MQAVFLPFVLFMCLCSLGKCQKSNCEKTSIDRKSKNVANVDLSSLDTSYEHGKAVRLRCEPGYTGLRRATCNDGHWSITGRSCEKKPCGHPGDTPNGDFELASGDDFVFGAVVQYMCKTGYRMMSRNSQRSCVASGWDNDIPVCEEVKCPIIQAADNVQASGNVEDGGYGDVIHFECQSPDMQLNGPGEIHCTDEGKWSGDIPTCREIQCEEPPISYGRVTNSQPVFRKDDILRYTCDEGYKASEGPNPKCTKTGWTSRPECQEIRCSLDNASPKTTRIPDRHFFKPGEKVEIECEDGFRTPTKKQKDSFLCGEDGNWPTRKTPDCETIYCSRPRDWNVHEFPRSKEYPYNSYDYKETVWYRCRWGYKKTKDFATCGLDDWTPKSLCVDINECISPTIENGFKVHPNKNTVVFSCMDGFKLNTGGWWRESHCSKGSWSPLTPKCIDQNKCTAPPVAEHVKYQDPAREIYSNGDSCRFQCDHGYIPKVQMIRCVDGEWEKPNCRRDGNWCTAPPNVINAFIDTKYEEWYNNEIKVKYTCGQSYQIDGKDTITCNSGNWTDHPKCIPVCAAPTDTDKVSYEFVKNETFYLDGEVLKFICKPGYRSEQLQQIECQNKAWGEPNCTRDNELCTTPPAIENGAIKYQEPHPKYPNSFVTVEYTCNEFHKMGGHHTITCNQGRWTDPPSCIKSSCGKPDGEHMELNPNLAEYDDGTTVRYMCKPPYTAKPGRELKCVNGQWNAKVECIVPRGSCVLPPAESDISVFDSQEKVFPHGTWRTFKCPLYYTFVDRFEEVKTFNNVCHLGKWHYPMRCWKPCTVTQKDMDDKNIQFRNPSEDLRYIGHRDHFTFICKVGKTKKREKDDMRRMCDDGIMELPECH